MRINRNIFSELGLDKDLWLDVKEAFKSTRSKPHIKVRGRAGSTHPHTGGFFVANRTALKSHWSVCTAVKRQFFAFYSMKLKINVIDKSLKKKISIRQFVTHSELYMNNILYMALLRIYSKRNFTTKYINK